MAVLRVLAVAAATGRVGYTFLVGGHLKDWGMSSKAAKSPTEAVATVQAWINELKPDVVVTEKTEAATRKGRRTKAIITAIAELAAHNYLLDIAVRRERRHDSKYEEAAELAVRYPEIAAWLPAKRRIFDNEPRNTVLFEALALAEEVLRGPTPTLARALG